MDSTNPCSQSPGYISHLNSQHECVVHENFPYGIFHGGGSELPAFSSQISEAPTPPEDTPRKTGEDGSQSSTTNVGDDDVRPEGVKAAKAKRNTGKGKAVDDYKSMWEIKREELAMKEKLSKLAILDTLLCKTGPLSEAEEVKEEMGQDYSYTQPSDSEAYGYNLYSGDSEREAYILEDQSLLNQRQSQPIHYPPQPEVEFGFPKVCYCGGQPLLDTSYTKNDPGRRYYTCENRDDGECHVWKWWDVAAMEEMRAMETQIRLLADKVDYLTCSSDYDTEQKVVHLQKILSDLGKKKSRFEFVVGVTAFVMVVMAVLLMF
ncbi:hypothetical protein Bca4012_085239 [Brassica carinata]